MTNPPDTDTTLDRARSVLHIEADAIRSLADRLDDRFLDALSLLASCNGRVIVTGMGKSGIIARKIAATLSSTGTAAYFLHPAEAVHGDLGVIQPEDLLLALSQSGETPEIFDCSKHSSVSDRASSPSPGRRQAPWARWPM